MTRQLTQPQIHHPQLEVTRTRVRNILTRTSGYLQTVTSHSLQPYRGCTLGRSLCGVGCYVQHNLYVTAGRQWGSFLEVRENAAASYLEHYARERAWARRSRQGFGVFLASATEPFLPQEFRFGITQSVLAAMFEAPPDTLILQTHSHRVMAYLDLYLKLQTRCALRVHLSIETDREMPGLPHHGSPIHARFAAAQALKAAGIATVITVSPLLPIADPERFFAQVAACADAVVIDHWIGGDGTPDGRRTRRTQLPQVVAALAPEALDLAYRDAMVEVAQRYLPGRVGIHRDGFAGRFLPRPGI